MLEFVFFSVVVVDRPADSPVVVIVVVLVVFLGVDTVVSFVFVSAKGCCPVLVLFDAEL